MDGRDHLSTMKLIPSTSGTSYGGTNTTNEFSQHFPQQFQQEFPQQFQHEFQQHFPQQFKQEFPQQFKQEFPQAFQQEFPQQFQQELPHKDGRLNLPDLNEMPTDNEKFDWAAKVKDDVKVATEILGIPLEDDSDGGSSNNDHLHSNGEEVGIRNEHWGMSDPLPCPPLNIKSRSKMSYQPTSHVKMFQTFENKKALRLAIGLKCVHENFQVKVKHSDKRRYEAVCINEGCEWRLMAAVVDNDTPMLHVRRFHDEHTCSRTQLQGNNRNATPQVLGHILKESFRDCKRVFRGQEIINDIGQRLNVGISYNQAWRGKMHALDLLRGSPESSFAQLPVYLHNLKKHNSGTVAEIALDEARRFDMLFLALGCSIRSFHEGLRPLLIMDCAHLKGTYVGSMFLAIGMDANNQIVPIALGVGKTESGQTWTWFLRMLKECIGEPANLTFVTDRAAAIDLAIRTVFPNAHHGLCARHLVVSLRLTSKRDKARKWMFWEACKAYKVSDFQATMDLMKHSLPEAAAYLHEVGYERWARSLFPGLRYSSMTSNSAEFINSITRFARYLPITMLVEFYRSTMQEWYYKRGLIAEELQHPLTPWVQAKIEKRIRKSATWRVHGISRIEFEVHDIHEYERVNLEERTCTCIQWQISGIPCGHLISVARHLNRTDCYQWAQGWFTSEAYRRTWGYQVNPLPPPSEYELPPERMTVLPPFMENRNSRRPRNRDRISSKDKEPIVKTCSQCHLKGHFRHKCSSSLSAPSSLLGSSNRRKKTQSRTTEDHPLEADETQEDVFGTYDLGD